MTRALAHRQPSSLRLPPRPAELERHDERLLAERGRAMLDGLRGEPMPEPAPSAGFGERAAGRSRRRRVVETVTRREVIEEEATGHAPERAPLASIILCKVAGMIFAAFALLLLVVGIASAVSGHVFPSVVLIPGSAAVGMAALYFLRHRHG